MIALVLFLLAAFPISIYLAYWDRRFRTLEATLDVLQRPPRKSGWSSESFCLLHDPYMLSFTPVLGWPIFSIVPG